VSARVSVVVPVYNVAAYLAPCLESLAQQTMGDLEVIMVDDGSTDESVEIAAAFAAQDARFRLVRQANAGLGAARNTGIEHATGEFLAFADSDDLVPPNAYAAFVSALDATGSDFASGNVRRLTSAGVVQAGFLARLFERRRLGTHVTRFPRLMSDRPAWNKLFRRSFWDEHGFRFPVGVLYEDSALTLRAHFLAKSVDVLDTTVYLWRVREGDDLSITQRRTDPKALRDRVTAVDTVSRFLAEHRLGLSKALYDRSVVGSDLRYFLDVIPSAGPEFCELFLDLANDFLDRADPWALEQPFAIDRLKWQLVRRRAVPELLEVLRFADEDLAASLPVRGRRHWYADYPYWGDRRLGISNWVFRLQDELSPVFKVEALRWEGQVLRIEGYAYIDLLGAPERDSQSVALVMRRAGRRLGGTRLEVEPKHRPDLTANRVQQVASLDWTGFAATLDARGLEQRDGGAWTIGAVIRAGGLTRKSWTVEHAPLRLIPPARVEREDGSTLEAAIGGDNVLTVRVEEKPPTVRSVRFEDGVLELEGELAPVGDKGLSLRVGSLAATDRRFPVHVDQGAEPATFLARVPLAELLASEDDGADEGGDGWTMRLVAPGFSRSLTLPADVPEASWSVDGHELAVRRTDDGDLSLVPRTLPPIVTAAEWEDGGRLVLTGTFPGPAADYDLVLRARGRGDVYVVPLDHDADAGVFRAELTPASVTTLAGPGPLGAGTWSITVVPRGLGQDAAKEVAFAPGVQTELPVGAKIEHKRFRLGLHDGELPVLAVDPDLDEDERGGLTQRRLRSSYYGEARDRKIREAVLYDCFDGREYSDSPRAVHEELVRRGLPLEHLWVVRDGACRVPETAIPVRAQSKEYYESYARARFLVASDHWPRWFSRRSEQTCLQTWHGAPLKRHGLDLAGHPPAVRAYREALRERAENWQYVVAPGSFATPLLRRTFPVNGHVLETGLPRTDVLVSPERHNRAEKIRSRLGLAGKRVVLYAPTYRDNLAYGTGARPLQLRDVPVFSTDLLPRGGYRLGPLADLPAVREALGEDDVILFRKHRDVVDGLPARAAAAVIDVSDYPDATELLLVADVLVTDYSSALFDFAATGKPVIFFTPDLERYRNDVRGFSIDFESEAPGPLVRSTEELIEALRDADAVTRDSRDRYEHFVASYCGLIDGGAAGRVVDAVFGR
jgi:CDP-glycerol glycerophosphotransferase